MKIDPVQREMKRQQDEAIEFCRHSAKVKQVGLCYICLMRPPCEHFQTVAQARAAIVESDGNS